MNSNHVQQIAFNYIREFGKNNGLNELEQVQKLHLEANEFTTDNNFLTPTLKMKRSLISQKYSSVIDKMYTNK